MNPGLLIEATEAEMTMLACISNFESKRGVIVNLRHKRTTGNYLQLKTCVDSVVHKVPQGLH